MGLRSSQPGIDRLSEAECLTSEEAGQSQGALGGGKEIFDHLNASWTLWELGSQLIWDKVQAARMHNTQQGGINEENCACLRSAYSQENAQERAVYVGCCRALQSAASSVSGVR